MHGIGATARASGLSVGTLRFYDGAGLLRPAGVDPRTGYRSYSADQVRAARLVAALRAAGMSLAGIRAVLRVRHDPAAVAAACAAHLRALEHDLAAARRALSTVDALLAPEESPVETTSVTVDAAELARALRAVRHAVSADPELPSLCGVLVEIGPGAEKGAEEGAEEGAAGSADGGTVTVVATDRYRLVAAHAPTGALTGPPVAALVPAALVDGVLGLLAGCAGAVRLTIVGEAITLTTDRGELRGALATEPFPDYRSLLPAGPAPTALDAVALRAAVAGPPTELLPGAGGAIREFTVLDAGDQAIWVDRHFLLEALDAAGDGAVVEVTDPLQPLAIRSPRALALVMPAAPPA